MSFDIKFNRMPVDMVESLTPSLVNLISKDLFASWFTLQTNDYKEHVIIDFRVDLTTTSIKECNVILT